MNEVEDVDLSESNAIGALDRFATNIGLAALALIPTLIILIGAPWRTAPLLSHEKGEGRRGLILAPGVFFLFSLFAGLMLGALLAPADSTVGDADAARVSVGVVIGPDEAARVAAALQEGNAWAALYVVIPVYFLVVFAGATTAWVRFIVGASWTVAMAVRASFYYFGATLCVAIAIVVAANRFEAVKQALPVITPALSAWTVVFASWLYMSFFRSPPVSASWLRSGLGAAAAGMSFFAAIMFATLAMRAV